MKTLRRILVAIKTPKARGQPALRKAAQLALGSGARLELFHAIDTPLYQDAYALQGQSLQQTQREWRERVLAQLEKLAAPLRKEGLNVTVGSDWDYPAYEAVVRAAQRGSADLIVAERHATRHILPTLLRFNDWELLRRSPMPVLLVKRGGLWRRPAVLGAIDPAHSFARPAKLDAAILAATHLMVQCLDGKAHVAHACPLSLAPSVRLSVFSPEVLTELDSRARRSARTAFEEAIARSGISGARKHFIDGHPVDVIRKVARKQRAGIVVMGAVSRSGLKRLVLGNVAEQVLDALPCDVLVIKPADFKPRVAARTRGVQLIPTPAYV